MTRDEWAAEIIEKVQTLPAGFGVAEFGAHELLTGIEAIIDVMVAMSVSVPVELIEVSLTSLTRLTPSIWESQEEKRATLMGAFEVKELAERNQQ